MEKQQIATIGSFCLNEACVDYQQIDLGKVVKCGKTDKGVQRYRIISIFQGSIGPGWSVKEQVW
jgi:hypothetical protein